MPQVSVFFTHAARRDELASPRVVSCLQDAVSAQENMSDCKTRADRTPVFFATMSPVDQPSRSGLEALAETYALNRGELYQLKLLGERLFEQFRSELAVNLSHSSAIRAKSTEVVCEVETWPGYSEFLPSGGVGVVLAAAPGGSVVLGAPDRIVRNLYVSLFRQPEKEDAEREPTEMERKISAGLMGRAILNAHNYVLSSLFRCQARVVGLDDIHAALRDAIKDDSRIVLLKSSISIAGFEDFLVFAIPLELLMPVRHLLSEDATHGGGQPNSEPARISIFRGALVECAIECAAVLAKYRLPVSALKSLTEGDVLPIGRPAADGGASAELRSGGILLRRGKIVEDQGWYRFQVTEETAEETVKSHGRTGG